MTFDDLVPGDSVFVGANPLVYYFAGDPAFGAACLLTNDAITVAIMQSKRLAKIASADTDFDRVPGILRYGPVWEYVHPQALPFRRRCRAGEDLAWRRGLTGRRFCPIHES